MPGTREGTVAPSGYCVAWETVAHRWPVDPSRARVGPCRGVRTRVAGHLWVPGTSGGQTTQVVPHPEAKGGCKEAPNQHPPHLGWRNRRRRPWVGTANGQVWRAPQCS